LRIFPFKEISPVMAVSIRGPLPKAKLTKLAVMVIPAEGPSFLLLPSGK